MDYHRNARTALSKFERMAKRLSEQWWRLQCVPLLTT